jgi:hypothetical protein
MQVFMWSVHYMPYFYKIVCRHTQNAWEWYEHFSGCHIAGRRAVKRTYVVPSPPNSLCPRKMCWMLWCAQTFKDCYARDVLTAQLAFVWHTQTTLSLLLIWRNSSTHWFITTIDLWKRPRRIMRQSPFASHLRLAAISGCHRPSSRVTVPAFKACAPHLPQQRSDNLC